jgi:hypothetical protein
MAVADRLRKEAGDLVRHQDWNELLAALDALEVDLGGRVGAVEARVEAVREEVGGRIGALEEGLADLRRRVEPLLAELFRVELSSELSTYALGAHAEVTARLERADGSPLDLSDAAARPWVDFLTVWGHLRPAPGTTSRGGVGDRTLSVQVDGDGVARVLVRAEHVRELSDDVDDEVATALTTHPAAAQASFMDIVLAASTPAEAAARGAFGVVATEYDRADSAGMRFFLDAYYLAERPYVEANVFRRPTATWRDHRTTVLAFAHTDPDPQTPDPGRGAASIQLTFRDWVPGFIHLGYYLDLEREADRFEADFRGALGTDFLTTVGRIDERIERATESIGLLGKQRAYQAMQIAIGRLGGDGAPDFADDVRRSVGGALALQRTIDTAQFAAGGGGGRLVAVDTVADTVRHTGGGRADVAVLGQRIGEIESRAQQALDGVRDLGTGFADLTRRTRDLDERAGTVAADVATTRRELEQFQVLDPSVVTSRIGEIGLLADRIANLEIVRGRPG